MSRIVLCDIDGCIADVRKIVRYLPDWDEYFRHQHECNPIPSTVRLLGSLLSGGHEVALMTGRPERLRRITYDWLYRVESFFAPCSLWMRPDNCSRSTQDIKMEWAEGLRPDLIIDDDPTVVKLAVGCGFTVLQVHGYRAGNADHDHMPGEIMSKDVFRENAPR